MCLNSSNKTEDCHEIWYECFAIFFLFRPWDMNFLLSALQTLRPSNLIAANLVSFYVLIYLVNGFTLSLVSEN